MKLYCRRAEPPVPFDIHPVEQWTLELFAAWQGLLHDAGAAVPSAADYLRETTVEQLVAVHNGALVGTVQVVMDTKERLHIHRLVVHPAWRARGVGSELIRLIDFNYTSENLWAYIDDDDAFQRTADLYLFEEVPSEHRPETFDLSEDVEGGPEGPVGGDGGGGAEERGVDGPGEPGEDREPRVGARAADGRVRRRGTRGGRRRAKRTKEEKE